VKRERLLPQGGEETRAVTGGVPRAFTCCEAINRLPYAEQDAIRRAWSELTGQSVDERFHLVPPVHSDHGLKLRVGANVFINHGCTLNDMGGIEIGEDCMIGPNVSLLTTGHPTPVADRRAGAVVSRDVPPATLVAGVPARALRTLD
jgi:acetyltransferase-like isoleucine patch superfamily enzyme